MSGEWSKKSKRITVGLTEQEYSDLLRFSTLTDMTLSGLVAGIIAESLPALNRIADAMEYMEQEGTPKPFVTFLRELSVELGRATWDLNEEAADLESSL